MPNAITVDDDCFPCLDEGDGPPILFVHGAASDHRVFAAHVARLKDRFRCIAPTMRWFGTGAWRQDGPAFGERAHATDLASMVEALGLQSVAVVGWSYGANVVLHLAILRPDLVERALVYETGAPGLVEDEALRQAHAASAMAVFGPIFAAVEAGDGEAVVRRLLEATGGPGAFDALPAEMRVACLENAHSMERLLSTKAKPDSVEAADLRAAKVPVTALWGDRSQPAWTIPSRALGSLVPGNHAAIPDAGHLWPLTDPEDFAARVAAWMEERDASHRM